MENALEPDEFRLGCNGSGGVPPLPLGEVN
jgi:hypothetical protein